MPFWGKPPFAFWSASLSLGGLGVNEFAVRFLSLLCIVLLILLGVGWLRSLGYPDKVVPFALVMATALLSFHRTGTLLTDSMRVWVLRCRLWRFGSMP